MPRVAAIDCGTNTIRLLIADVGRDQEMPVREVVRQMRTVRLGEGIERTGRFADAALERTEAALREYADLIAASGIERGRMVATSASRDVVNRDRLIELATDTVGLTPEVISGREEGLLTFDGVRSGLAMAGPSIVLDIGGGSTELVVGDASGVRAGVSMDIGVVRLTERYVETDPPTNRELDAIAQATTQALSPALQAIAPYDGLPVIGVAGTATTAAAIAAGLSSYDSELIHARRVSRDALRRVRDWACTRDSAQRREHPAMHPGRALVFPAGMVILDEVLSALGTGELVVSESDILDGIALSIAG